MIMPCRVSVVIPTYQRCALLHRALQALSLQTLSPNEYEVIISIDGSQDGTEEMVSHFPAPYTLRSIWQPNRGRAAACNAGIRIARGQLLVLLDDDMEPLPTFLEAHLCAHPDGSRLGVVGAAPITLGQSSSPIVQYVGLKFNGHLENLAQPRYQFKLRDFYSGNFSIRREVLLEVGAFDESFNIYGNEDLELSVRLSKASVELVFSAEALAHQHYTKDFAALARDNIAKGRTAVLLAMKYPQTYYHLKLSMYAQGSRIWRFLRAWLLQLSRAWAQIPEWVIFFITWLERRRSARFHYCCFLALDYFYWLGARSALRENSGAGQGLTSLATSAGKPRS
ncbi:MAG TPA: glycosyltransferase family 2 protein [Candidatus Binatia bacterium]|nr:glycosyltransferase family 2 protein [Candidatus Binatia bacterium]